MEFLQFRMAIILRHGCLRLPPLQLKKDLVMTFPTYIETPISSGNFLDLFLLLAHFRFHDQLIVSCLLLFNCRTVEATIEKMSIPSPGSEPLKFDTTFSQDIISQFCLCLQKQLTVYWRSPQYNAVRLLFTTVCALILGSVFWDVGSKR